ncbi:MAG: LapA family protein [Burkholderiales bacterium]|nr:LapA family protein [Burkholderiales bacterium]
MKRVSNLLAWGALAVAVALIVLNWSTLMTPAPLNLVVAEVQAPLGVVMLGITGVLVALFFIAYLQNLIGSLLETRRLLKEVQRMQDLADKAEASRVENLHQLVATEFRLLHERLDTTGATAPLATPERKHEEAPVGILPPPM